MKKGLSVMVCGRPGAICIGDLVIDPDEGASSRPIDHDLDGSAEGVAGPVDEPAGEALVCEDVPGRGGHAGTEQAALASVAVLPTRGADGHGESRPAVSVTMNLFRPLIFFPAS
ncbi:hypothetical protein [Micromonospora sp. NBC_00898]|uniref:hypothetical protein n=1 Tax=Micromonospora sp. NBC_00898 TaxID=2975981 RepID=UPI0038649B3D